MFAMCTDIRATEIRRRLTWSNNLIQCVNGTCNTATGILSQIQLCTVAQLHLPLLNSSTDTINICVLDLIVLLSAPLGVRLEEAYTASIPEA